MKKKVLFFIYQLQGGGAEKVMVDIVNHFDFEQYNITVMTIIKSKNYKEVLNNNITYKYRFTGRFLIDRIFFKLFWWLNPKILYPIFIKEKFDFEIAALEGVPLKIISGSNNQKSKKIAFIHANCDNIAWPKKRFRNLSQERESYLKFSKIICVSDSTMLSFMKKFNMNDGRVMKIFNPVDIDKIVSLADLPITENNLIDSPMIFISVGRLDKVKAFDKMIKAIYELNKEFGNVGLYIIGDGVEMNNLLKLISSLGLEEKIKLLGYKSNPYKYIAKSNYYVCSSVSEGLSTSIIEALVLNIPIVTTDCGGMHELLHDGQCGLIVPNSISELTNGMRRVINDNDFVLKMLNEQKKCIDRFSFNSYYTQLYKIFDE